MYDYGLVERIEKVPAQKFQEFFISELVVQKELPGNGAWAFGVVSAMKHAVAHSNGFSLENELRAMQASSFKKRVLIEIEYQRMLMTERQGKQTNNFRPLVCFLRAVLERLGRNNDGNKAGC